MVIALGVAAADWLTKALVVVLVPLGHLVEVVPGRMALWHVRNHEMILGLWGNLTLDARQVIALTAFAMALLLAYELVGRGHRLPGRRRRWVWWFGGLAFGGMLGNLGERLVHWGVTDFLSFRWGALWLPPGNIADLALFLSIPLALPVIFFELQARSRREPPQSEIPAADSRAVA